MHSACGMQKNTEIVKTLLYLLWVQAGSLDLVDPWVPANRIAHLFYSMKQLKRFRIILDHMEDGFLTGAPVRPGTPGSPGAPEGP